MAAATTTVYPEAAAIEDGRLSIGGCDAVELAREFGTPAYVYAEDDLRARAREAVGAMERHHGPLDARSTVAFASKAFPCTAALRLFRAEGLAVDVASEGELHLARRAGFTAAETIVHGNAKSEGELAAALGAALVLDNREELDRLERLGAGRGQRVLLRITPGVSTDTHAAVATGQADSKFGFSMADAPAAVEAARAALDLRGLHVHVGSQIFDERPYREAVAALATLGPFPEYDLGGGFGVAYTEDQRSTPLDERIGAMVAAAHDLLDARDRHLTIEPGRALVAAAGITLYTVESVKRNVSTWVAVDGGMSDNLRPLLYGSPYRADVADRAGTGETACHLAGKHCESGDVIARDVVLDDPRPGDVIATPVTGAYGHALANNYNGVPRPPVIFCSQGEARVVVRRETVEDLHARDV